MKFTKSPKVAQISSIANRVFWQRGEHLFAVLLFGSIAIISTHRILWLIFGLVILMCDWAIYTAGEYKRPYKLPMAGGSKPYFRKLLMIYLPIFTLGPWLLLKWQNIPAELPWLITVYTVSVALYMLMPKSIAKK